ncbi:MAG TPA: HEAT repeat domain-containing protein, partial [Thermoguttaceae bacterium]|nr:HEAT repeat domain-containing protein [Thermoguttaceae bacterium]
LRDGSPNVRIAAAEVLCTLGHEKDALPVLVGALQDADPRVRLHAAAVLVALGEKARDVLPQIQEAAADRGQDNHALYTRWALEHAVESLEHAQ